MSPETTTISFIVAGILFVVLFGKALQVLVERTQPFWSGKKNRENELFRIEQNALNIKIDALKMKLDAVRSELHALRARVDTIPTQLPDQVSISPNSQPILPEAEIDDRSLEQDTWARLEKLAERKIDERPSDD